MNVLNIFPIQWPLELGFTSWNWAVYYFGLLPLILKATMEFSNPESLMCCYILTEALYILIPLVIGTFLSSLQNMEPLGH